MLSTEDKIGLIGDAAALAVSGEGTTPALLALTEGFAQESNYLSVLRAGFFTGLILMIPAEYGNKFPQLSLICELPFRRMSLRLLL